MSYSVALCGLSAKDSHLVEIVITRAPNPKHAFRVLKRAETGVAQIALVDADNPLGMAELAERRTANPQLVGVFISDHGMMGDSRYRIERKSLLLRVLRTLEEVVDQEMGSNKVRSLGGSAVPQGSSAGRVAPAGESAFASAEPEVPTFQAEVQPLRALIVDDSLTVREQLRGALERAGLRADMAENAEQAMGLLQQQGYDIAFLDVVMPGIDGYELCRKIKANAYTRSLPVLMLTSRSSPFDRARGALAGCDTYLVKPITWEGFYQALDKSLAKHFRNDRETLARRGYKLSQAR